MGKVLSILEKVSLYSNHAENNKTNNFLEEGTFVNYNREKRRNGVNWYEVYLANKQKAYVKKDKSKIFVCKYCEIKSRNVKGFSYTKLDENLTNNEIFNSFTERILDVSKIGFVNLYFVDVDDKEIETTTDATIEYDKTKISVTDLKFYNKENFYQVRPLAYKQSLLEVNDFKGKKRGYILAKTNYNEVADNWINTVAIIFAILTVLAIFFAFLESGWIVVSGLMLIPAFIVGIIGVIIIKIIIGILKGTFKQIYKRF
jgi:hypothetical protein